MDIFTYREMLGNHCSICLPYLERVSSQINGLYAWSEFEALGWHHGQIVICQFEFAKVGEPLEGVRTQPGQATGRQVQESEGGEVSKGASTHVRQRISSQVELRQMS